MGPGAQNIQQNITDEDGAADVLYNETRLSPVKIGTTSAGRKVLALKWLIKLKFKNDWFKESKIIISD